MYNFYKLKYITYKRLIDGSNIFFPSYFFKNNFILDINKREIIKNALLGKDKGLYIHIPFCLSKCSYCFCISKKLSSGEELDKYIDYILKELKLYIDLLGVKNLEFDTIVFGGGTPSIFNLEQLEKLFEGLKRYVDIEKADEISIESSPYTLSKNKIDILLKNKVTRISLGIQSFDEKVLKTNNRPYMPFEKINEIVQYIKMKGMKIQIDLMSGIKGQDIKSCIEDYKKLNKLQISDFTMNYFYPNERAQYQDNKEFIKLKKQVKKIYNNLYINRSGYTLQQKRVEEKYYYSVLGIGAGSESIFLSSLIFEKKNILLYYDKIDKGEIPIETGLILNDRHKALRYFLNNIGLGVSLKDLNSIYNINFLSEFKKEIKIFLTHNLIFIRNGFLYRSINKREIYLLHIYFSLLFLDLIDIKKIFLEEDEEKFMKNFYFFVQNTQLIF